MRDRFALVLTCLAALLFAAEASANALYHYAGNPFVDITDNAGGGGSQPAGSYTTAMSLSILVELTGELAPNLALQNVSAEVLDWTAMDGRLTLTPANSGLLFFFAATDASGTIVDWDFRVGNEYTSDPPLALGDQLQRIETVTFPGPSDIGTIADCLGSSGCIPSAFDQGQVEGDPGSWTLVPEPGAAPLLAAGLALLAARRR